MSNELTPEKKQMLDKNKEHFARLKPALTGKGFNEDGYEIAIKRAVRDLTVRTLTPKEEKSSENLLNALIDRGNPDSLLCRIKDYFEKDPYETAELFDEWHRKICAGEYENDNNGLLKLIGTYYKNKDGSDVCYGKAQKILNMTLKGCYCLDNSENYENHFEYCHMPLDFFTLEWFYRDVCKWFNGLEGSGENIKKEHICSWSVIKNVIVKDKEGKKTPAELYRSDCGTRFFEVNVKGDESKKGEVKKYYHYSFLQDIIRGYFKSSEEGKYNGFTPLKAEFIIWPEIQLHLSCEALFAQSIGQDEIIERIDEIQREKNAEELKKAKEELEERKKAGKKRNKTREDTIKKLEEPIDNMDKAVRIYKNLSLKEKVGLLAEKIELMKTYCDENGLVDQSAED